MQYISMEHLRFLLFEVYDIQDLFQYEHFSHLDAEQVSLMIESAKALADRDMFPFFREMDEKPIHYLGNGEVWSHPQLKTIIRNAAEQNWIGDTALFDQGGMQLPEMVHSTAQSIFIAANNSAQGYLGLTVGSSRLITSFGSQELIDTYIPKMFAGEWQGTMALTEPQAGSSLTDITTSAKPDPNGYYAIKGQKIFISAGQHQACNNFVHLTLGRIEGAPPGVKGISLFVIPKFRPEPDGSLTYNDVFCAADYQKLGQRAYATTHLVFGEQDNCQGWLVGEPHKGLSYMFQMMNEARVGVGLTAAATASGAYYASLQYSKERPQGRRLSSKDPLRPQVPIIQHADIQRMLLTQKAIVEGSLALATECNRLSDLIHVTTEEEKKKHWLLLEMLTPIMKTYASEQGNRSTSHAIQIYGGYGYTMDFPAQQYYRDLRIMSLYEGTTGIQSLDLLGRKVTMENGQALQLLSDEIMATSTAADEYLVLKPAADQLRLELQRIGEVLQHLGGFARSGNLERYTSDATVFMEMAGHVVIAWQWLKMAVVAQKSLEAGDFTRQSKNFYAGKIHTMQFFFRYELPHAAACAKTLMAEGCLTNLEDYLE